MQQNRKNAKRDEYFSKALYPREKDEQKDYLKTGSLCKTCVMSFEKVTIRDPVEVLLYFSTIGGAKVSQMSTQLPLKPLVALACLYLSNMSKLRYGVYRYLR
jgi:hypothetical protein